MNRIAQPDLYRVWGGMSSAKGVAVDSIQHLLVNQFTLMCSQPSGDRYCLRHAISEVQAFDWSKQQKEIAQGKPLSPILLVRQDNGGHLIIADGFHRMCALFAHDQEIKVPCKIV